MRSFMLYMAGIISGVLISACFPAFADFSNAKNPLLTQKLQTIVEIWNRIQSDYVDTVDDDKLMNGCISGMASLDAYSRFITNEEFKGVVSPPKNTASIGLEIKSRGGQIIVVAPIDGSPAARAGVRAGDILLSINDESTTALPLYQIVARMHGAAGSKVSLRLWRESDSIVLEPTLNREILNISSVSAKLLASNITYLHISQFNNSSGHNVLEAVNKANGSMNPHGFVIDLRNNTGGTIDGTVDVANLFSSSGLIMSIDGRTEHMHREFTAKGPAPFSGIPITILVNNGTAAGAEILADFLRNSSKAKILGVKTFGSGTIQTIMPLSNDTALKITTGRWKTASGETLEGHGLEPSIKLSDEDFIRDPDTDPWVAQAVNELML